MFYVYKDNEIIGTMTYREVLKIAKNNKDAAEWRKNSLVVGSIVYIWKEGAI